MNALTSADQFALPAAGQRAPLRLREIFEPASAALRPVLLIDLNSGGFRAAGRPGVAPGEALRVAIPGLGEVAARVKWVEGDSFGAEFIGPPDLRRLFIAPRLAPHPTWIRSA